MVYYKIFVSVPSSHADVVREAIGKVGAGEVGKYTFCSFSTKGIRRFKSGDSAKLATGNVEKLEAVEEERIEVTCRKDRVTNVINAVKQVHPHEESVLDVIELCSWL